MACANQVAHGRPAICSAVKPVKAAERKSIAPQGWVSLNRPELRKPALRSWTYAPNSSSPTVRRDTVCSSFACQTWAAVLRLPGDCGETHQYTRAEPKTVTVAENRTPSSSRVCAMTVRSPESESLSQTHALLKQEQCIPPPVQAHAVLFSVGALPSPAEPGIPLGES